MKQLNIEFLSKIRAYIESNDTLKAEKELHLFLRKDSKNLNALHFLVQVFTIQNKFDDAIKTYKKIIKLDKNQYKVWYSLGNIYMQIDNMKNAQNCYVKYDQIDPFKDEIIKIENAIYNQSYDIARKLCSKILKLDPHHINSIKIMTQILMKQGTYHEALNLLNRGIKFAPYNIDLWYILVDLNAIMGRHIQRTSAAIQTTELNPKHKKSWNSLANAYAFCGKYQKALLSYQNAEKIDSNDANIPLQKGHMLKALGKRKKCIEAYRKSISLYAYNGSAYWGLANLKNFKFVDGDLKKLKILIKNNKSLPDQSVQAKFAIGKAYEDKGKFDLAFKFYQEANDEKTNINFNSINFERQCQKLLSGLSKNDFDHNIQSNEITPIFIVGLPRSGSTLLEQILASHSKIEGTMELQTLPFILNLVNNKAKKQGLDLRSFIKGMSSELLTKIGTKYITDTEIFRTNKKYFIDKLPSNFLLVDIIHKILPNAIIIDARRNPMDNGFSIYKQHFANGNDFSYKLANIAQYYKNYLKIMAHWDDILPRKIRHVQYEDIVFNTENEVKKLLEYCDLDFEENCLNFHKNKRPVNTASSEQVRQPIYTKGVNYWLNFEKHLSPLSQALM